MTLRTRLTTAFLLMVLGPVLLGAVFVGTTATKVSADRAKERLDFAASAVRTSVGSLCRQLQTVAEAVASTSEDQRLVVAAEYVQRGLISGVHIDRGASGETTPGAPPPPWADCSGTGHQAVAGYEAISANATLADGTVISAATTVDVPFVARLSGATGAALTMLPASAAETKDDTEIVGIKRVSAEEPIFSTLQSDEATAVAQASQLIAAIV